MNVDAILAELSQLATERMKKYYLAQGVREPVYGAPTGAMKPIARPLNGNQAIAEALYATGVFDAMYLAGMICDVDAMKPADFRRWMDQAYCTFIAESVVAVSLAETSFAQELAVEFITSSIEAHAAGGWSCYEWLLGSRKDHEFDAVHITNLLDQAATTIATAPPRVQSTMIRFVVAVGVSYIPAHAAALATASRINATLNPTNDPKSPYADPYAAIVREVDKGRIGFKRRHVRC
jgi:hypothetical protein